ncbi:ATP-binding protein [Actinomadura alba]|uniref:ATP-binding protein n=1 Tax=Actinomadura alba TaxID=406431 RepID=A0ABR7LWX8_9ACTN|nr:ATP-binding protein [Actinomadura alba]MBC6468970.1 ATP-binding protein [Actinomadura alba]
MKARFSFVATPDRVTEARTLTEVTLMSWSLRPFVENARLIVSELVTNAVAATPGKVVLLVLAREEDAVSLGVWDSDDTTPAIGGETPPSPNAESGRGLYLVGMLSDEHGSQRVETGGKIMWARLRT